ncbi:MAG: hypothetical protein RRY36_09480 [Bacteroidaceae bacterium]
MQTKSVQSFFYYMWNAWNKKECELVFKEQGWVHIWSKWIAEHEKGVRGASERFFCELDSENQSLLVERACELYDGRARREKTMAGHTISGY